MIDHARGRASLACAEGWARSVSATTPTPSAEPWQTDGVRARARSGDMGSRGTGASSGTLVERAAARRTRRSSARGARRKRRRQHADDGVEVSSRHVVAEPEVDKIGLKIGHCTPPLCFFFFYSSVHRTPRGLKLVRSRPRR